MPEKDGILRLAMWSGPRNISTAMMRSWGNRGDTHVVDEPFYAYYLKSTGLPHPMADEVMASQPTDWRDVVDGLLGPVPGNKPLYYQKHMTHHFLDEVGREWLGDMTHVFLIRDPREMLVSLDEKTPEPALKDTGYPQQLEIFEWVKANTGQPCPVIDSKDLLMDPEGMLAKICGILGIEFDKAMMSWPAGRRETDGVWAEHWYGNVEKSTGFQPYKPKSGEVQEHLKDLLDECRPYYETLKQHALNSKD